MQAVDAQKLLDITYEMVYRCWENTEWLKKATREEVMEWVQYNTNACGFRNKPMGSSWGVLY